MSTKQLRQCQLKMPLHFNLHIESVNTRKSGSYLRAKCITPPLHIPMQDATSQRYELNYFI